MYVLAALACLHARAEDGDLEVRNVFESLGVKRFPAKLPAFTSSAAWRGGWGSPGGSSSGSTCWTGGGGR